MQLDLKVVCCYVGSKIVLLVCGAILKIMWMLIFKKLNWDHIGISPISTITLRSDPLFILGICFVIWVKTKVCLGLWLAISVRSHILLKNKEAICGPRGIWKLFMMFYTIMISMTWDLLVGGTLRRGASMLRLISENDLTGVWRILLGGKLFSKFSITYWIHSMPNHCLVVIDTCGRAKENDEAYKEILIQ